MTAALLFDYGGTLDADGLSWKDRFRRLYRALGVDPTDGVFDSIFFAADDGLHATLPPACGLSETVARLTFAVSSGLRVGDSGVTAQVAKGFLEASFANLAVSRELLTRLRRRYRLGLVSNFYGNLDAVCEEAGIAAVFDVRVDSGRVGFTKPDPRIFRYATAALGVSPGAATFIGDSLSRDMVGARSVGMHHIWVTGPVQTPPNPCCPGDRVILRLADLEGVLS